MSEPAPVSKSRLFTPITLRGITARNRIVIAPMLQYSAKSDGMAHDWHFAHLGRLAMGGAGIVMKSADALRTATSVCGTTRRWRRCGASLTS
jgi:2,4-dienoyl-CoA reductase-like NADH-dependent reductase (Old Yellow Enzyme family)